MTTFIEYSRPKIITPIKRVAHPGNKLITIGGQTVEVIPKNEVISDSNKDVRTKKQKQKDNAKYRQQVDQKQLKKSSIENCNSFR